MKYLLILFAVSFVLLQALPALPAAAPVRLGVIGAGMGGSSASYFINNMTGSNTKITIFESELRVGGRVYSTVRL